MSALQIAFDEKLHEQVRDVSVNTVLAIKWTTRAISSLAGKMNIYSLIISDSIRFCEINEGKE